MTSVTRREFIAASTSFVALASAGELPGQASDQGKPWYATVRRCGQLNLNKRDPLTLDAEAWMASG